MRSTCSLYIDAGYLLASAATRVTGTSLRAGINVNYDVMIRSLIDTAVDRSGLPLLRVHWYDSADNAVPDAQQARIGELPKVKLRLGRFGIDGQQKGVDLRIGLDLVAHARNDTSDVFFLISGDDDLTEAVEEAQAHGVQVTVLAVPTVAGKPHGLSRHLVRAADEIAIIDGAVIDESTFKVEVPRPAPSVPVPAKVAAAAKPGPSPRDIAPRPQIPGTGTPITSSVAYSSSTGGPSVIHPSFTEADDFENEIDSVVDHVLATFNRSATAEDRRELARARPSIPRDIDRALLLDASDAMGNYDISESVRFRLRSRFWEKYEECI